MGELWIADISTFDLPDGRLPRGQNARKVRFLGEIVSAASLMAVGEFQVSSVGCRRRPQRRRCPGKIRLGRDPDTDEIQWGCPACGDRGVITNWRETRWDLSLELKKGHIISLSEERARRAGRLTSPIPLRVYEFDVELIYAPVVLEERVCRQVRLSGDHSLHDLHRIIHLSYDRVDDEAYEFMFGPPYEPETQRFTGSSQDGEVEEVPFEAKTVVLDSLGLKPGDSFGYLFDFSDEWIHRLTVSSVKELNGRRVAPQVTGRAGDSPPQLPTVEEAWDDDLFWNDVETTYPLTGLYGPYRAEEGVDPSDWLALDELERHLLVMEAHTHSMPPDHHPVNTMLLHAVVHVIAESQLADLGPRKARSVLKPLLEQEDGCRHRAIHRLGEELVRNQLVTTPPTPARGKGRRPRG
jgi:hypothetical protein